jgi:hypothetical protein
MNYAVIAKPNYFSDNVPAHPATVVALCETLQEGIDYISSCLHVKVLSHGQFAPTSYDVQSVKRFAFDNDLEEPSLDWLDQGASEDDANDYEKVAAALHNGEIKKWYSCDYPAERIVACKVK